MDLTEAQRTILLSAHGFMGIVEPPIGLRGGDYQVWVARCRRLTEIGLLKESPRYRGSFYITVKGKQAVEC